MKTSNLIGTGVLLAALATGAKAVENPNRFLGRENIPATYVGMQNGRAVFEVNDGDSTAFGRFSRMFETKNDIFESDFDGLRFTRTTVDSATGNVTLRPVRELVDCREEGNPLYGLNGINPDSGIVVRGFKADNSPGEIVITVNELGEDIETWGANAIVRYAANKAGLKKGLTFMTINGRNSRFIENLVPCLGDIVEFGGEHENSGAFVPLTTYNVHRGFRGGTTVSALHPVRDSRMKISVGPRGNPYFTGTQRFSVDPNNLTDGLQLRIENYEGDLVRMALNATQFNAGYGRLNGHNGVEVGAMVDLPNNFVIGGSVYNSVRDPTTISTSERTAGQFRVVETDSTNEKIRAVEFALGRKITLGDLVVTPSITAMQEQVSTFINEGQQLYGTGGLKEDKVTPRDTRMTDYSVGGNVNVQIPLGNRFGIYGNAGVSNVMNPKPTFRAGVYVGAGRIYDGVGKQ